MRHCLYTGCPCIFGKECAALDADDDDEDDDDGNDADVDE